MQSVKNAPRTPEEQQKAMEQFLASQETNKKNEKTERKSKRGPSLGFLRSTKKSSPAATCNKETKEYEETHVSPTSPAQIYSSPPSFRMLDVAKSPVLTRDNTNSHITSTNDNHTKSLPKRPPLLRSISERPKMRQTLELKLQPLSPSKMSETTRPLPPTDIQPLPIKQGPPPKPPKPKSIASASSSPILTGELPSKPRSNSLRLKDAEVQFQTSQTPPTVKRTKFTSSRPASVKLITPFGDYLKSPSPTKTPEIDSIQNETGPILTKTSKNKPLTPEEQQQAFEEYLKTLESEKKKDKSKHAAPKEKIVIAKTSKNKPLTPEEQQDAFEEFIANMESEREKHVIIAKTSKNRPLTPEEQQKAFEEYEASVAQNSRMYMKRAIGSSKNEPRTPEQQRLALKQFLQQTSATEDPKNLAPLPKGEDLMRFLLTNYNVVASTLDAAKNINQQEVVVAILDIFIQKKAAVKLITASLQRDLKKNGISLVSQLVLFTKRSLTQCICIEVETTLFRDNTPATQLFSAYCKLKGREYIEGVLAVYLERLIYRKEALEVDPCRCSDEEAAENTKLLHSLINEILERVFSSQADIPRCLGQLFYQLQEMVHAKYPEQVAKILGGFYFLRFFSPMTVSPKLNGLLDCAVSSQCRRSLILCTKVVQSLSNNVPFTTEEYMLPFNDIITGRQEDMKKFLMSIGDFQHLKNSEEQESETEIQNTKNKSLRILAKSLASNFAAIREDLQNSNFSPQKLQKLSEILQFIQLEEPIGWKDE